MTHKLFVGGYAPADQPGIQAFDFDEATGALAALSSFAGIFNPSYLALHPAQPWLFAVSETAQVASGVGGHVWALRFDRATLALQAVNHQATAGDWPCHLLVDSTGKWLLASNYGTGSVGVFPIRPDGSLGGMTHLVQHAGSSVNQQRQEAAHAHSTCLTPDNRLLIVADLGLDQLVLYQLDTGSGKLLPHGRAGARPGAGPRHMAFHPGGRWLYVANELDSTVSVYDYDAGGGTLAEVQSLATLPPGAPENYVADIHLAPDGARLYVSNRGHDSLAVYSVGGDGRLALLAVPPCGGNWPRNFALSPGGGWVLAANERSGTVTVLPVEAGGAELGAPRPGATAAGASCIQFVMG
jgi:6-phosphogluconolactonase